MITFDEVFKIGTMGRPHGIRGAISMHFTDDVFDTVDADYLVCNIDGILVPFFMEEWTFKGVDTAIIKFEGLDSEEAVKLLQGVDVYFPKSLAEERSDSFSSWQALTGFSVSDTRAGHLGTVTGVDDSSANILLETQTDEGGALLLPVHPDLVAEINVRQRTLRLNLPEGILDLN
jgi:16S rRNA processing protein RimM